MKKPFALVIEDDIALSEMFAVVLQTSNVDTKIIRDGGKAMTAIIEDDPDIVLLDMHLPNVSGRKILEDIRADERFAGLQVVVITANAQMALASDELADAVLLKPVSFDQLAAIATRFMHRPGGKLATREMQSLKIDPPPKPHTPLVTMIEEKPTEITQPIIEEAESEGEKLPDRE